mgnify:CR=1 FL=1
MLLAWPDLAVAAGAVAVGYTLFGFGGFGANIVSLPLLAHMVPLRFAVPMMLVLDLAASAFTGLRQRELIAVDEVRRLLPWLLGGMIAGATLLVRAGEEVLLALLGSFVVLVAGWSLWSSRHGGTGGPPASTAWGRPAGLVGGVFSALFGSGGPVYTLYLARRLAERARLRATVATLILGAALTRGVLFIANGLLMQPGLLATSMALLPAVAVLELVGLAALGLVDNIYSLRRKGRELV